IALVCGVLMLISGRWSKWPLAAIAVICLALVQSGLIKMQNRLPCVREASRQATERARMRPQLAARPLHLFEAAVGAETRLAGTPSRHVGGMCLAHACGRSVAPLLWPGSHKIAEDRVALVGGRALDPGERATLDRSKLTRIRFDAEQADLSGIIAFARKRKIWLHVD